MAINNPFIYLRELDLSRFIGSAFLFGPRMTGKTALLKTVPSVLVFDLMDPTLELELRGEPKRFFEEIGRLPPDSLVVVDEIQRVPSLLDYVQLGIERKGLRFILSGSSARKLRRGSANLLGGRASDLRLHPLTHKELGRDFDIEAALRYGTLPKIATLLREGNEAEAKRLLKSYHSTYLKEEVQAEAMVRKLDSFQRFLVVAAQSNAQMIEYANISRESGVAMETVKDYFQILEDTLIGSFLWPFDRSERKKARPKFYFFDCGVLRVLQNLTGSAIAPSERGFLFETWFINEIRRVRDYMEKDHTFSLWREGDREIDLVIESGRGFVMAFECKSGKQVGNYPAISAFRAKYPKIPLFICSLQSERRRRLDNGAEVISWKEAIRIYRDT